MCTTLALIVQKGGTGKTTLAGSDAAECEVASRLDELRRRVRIRLGRILVWMLAGALGISVGQSQFRPRDYRAGAARQELERTEYERWRQVEAAYAAR